MKGTKKFIYVYLLTILLASCSSVQFKYSTLNHAQTVDGIYNSNTVFVDVPIGTQIDTLNYFQLQRKLRTDFRFRYDYAQYALSQPISFDWNNRTLGNRYNFYNPYYSRSQMWDDWVWGYNWNSPHRWSPFGYDRWGYNNFGWNNYYGWNNHGWGSYWNNHSPFYGNRWNNYNRRGNVAYINGRRSSGTSIVDRRAHAAMIETSKRRNFVIEEDGVRWYSGSEQNNKEIITPLEKEVKILEKRIINSRRNDKTINTNTRIYVRPEGSNNGRWRGSRQIVPTKPTILRQPATVQPRQVRRGSGSSVPQQTRTRIKPGS